MFKSFTFLLRMLVKDRKPENSEFEIPDNEHHLKDANSLHGPHGNIY